ncbi:hypothetical protein [Caldimonas tepidiphila]|uniref:hypothetical protein n=1 Tax=Caldimonas tepidiphila TaxID=2315841 RepID=UPI00130095B6|nr:hypothetical protein [Caldimonas tepidiphila]
MYLQIGLGAAARGQRPDSHLAALDAVAPPDVVAAGEVSGRALPRLRVHGVQQPGLVGLELHQQLRCKRTAIPGLLPGEAISWR